MKQKGLDGVFGAIIRINDPYNFFFPFSRFDINTDGFKQNSGFGVLFKEEVDAFCTAIISTFEYQ